MSSVVKSMNSRQWITLILLSMLWGGSFFFIEIAVEHVPPFTLVATRVTLAALCLLMIVYMTGLRIPLQKQVWGAFLGVGVLTNLLPFCAIVWGQTYITGGLAAILVATTPFFTVIAAHMFTSDEKITAEKLTGVAIGLAGVAIMIGYETLAGINEYFFAQLAVLGAAMCYALGGIFGRRFQRMGVQPMIAATGQLIASSALLIPLAMFFDSPLSLIPQIKEAWAAILGLAILSTSLAYLLFYRLLATAGATNASLVTLLIPVSAILLGTTLLGERLLGQHLIGMACIFCGLLIIDGRLAFYLKLKLQSAQSRSTGG